MMKTVCIDQDLSNESIDLASREAEGFMREAGVERKNLLRQILILEETLLKYQAAWGPEARFCLKCGKHLHRLRLELSLVGPSFNPYDSGEETDSEVLRGLLAGMGLAPSWQYQDGRNLVVFSPRKKKRSQTFRLVLAIGLALAIGLICRLLPAAVPSFISQQLLTPIFDTFMGLLSAIAGPMIFLSVAWSIYSIGDTATLGRIGKRMISRFLLMTLLLSILGILVFLPFFSMEGGGGISFNFSELFDIVLDIAPGNLFTPFTEGNPLQIIFVAVVMGLAMLVLDHKTTVVASLVEQANSIIQLIMETLNSFLPIFIFINILNMILGNNFSALLQSYKLILLFVLGCLMSMLVYILLVCAHQRIRPVTLLRKLAPTFLIGLTTASSSAAFSANLETCRQDLGIDEKIVNFGVPLGQVVFMPNTSVLFLAIGLCMAEIYHVPISLTWLLTALVICVVLAVAAPPIQGGGLTCYAILLMQLSIPAEALGILITLDIILDFLDTASNLLILQTELIETASSLHMLDRQCLRSEKKPK